MLPVEPPPSGLEARAEVVPAAQRFETRTDWLTSRHSFSFGPHYDPANTHHGVLLVNNDDVVSPGRGFGAHPHRDAEILTWVLDGSLTHEDSTGSGGVIRPGLAQRMSAGRGVRHSERNDGTVPVHFVQMWVVPDELSAEPGYEQADVGKRLRPGALVTVASGMPEHEGFAAVGLGQRRAAFHVARLGPGDQVELPAAPYLHVFVARGGLNLADAGPMASGDAARLTNKGVQKVTGTSDAEVLVWEMHATVTA